MNITQLKEIYTHNQDVSWKKAYDIVLARFIDEGHSLSEAYLMTDDHMFQMNWTLANPPKEWYTD